MEATMDSSQAADYLGITLREFALYNDKSYIPYQLRHGRRYFTKQVLDTFAKDVLKKDET